nr:hypothetical protein [Tanacetum cinerariifolium]
KVVDDVSEDEDFKGGSWVSAVEFVNANGRRIVNGCLGYIENYLKNGQLDISVGGSLMLLDEEEIVKLMEEEEMADFELQVCGNIIDQEDLYKFDEEALNLASEEEARQARAEHEWLKKSEGGEARGSSGALKPSTYHVIAIFLPLGAEVEAACALEVKALGAL